MANSFKVSTVVWEVDSTGTLIADAPQMANPVVRKVVLIPNAAADTVTFQGGDSETAIYLSAGGSDTSPTQIDFGDKGKRVPGLQCSAGSTGMKAYVYLM